jgi:hypothetical protein
MSNSQNGWPVDPPRRSRLVAGTPDVRVTVADGPAGDVLMYVLAQVHERVEPLTLDGTRGELDDWGYASRPIRGGTETSNHASATAVDMNATRHPLGAIRTFTAKQVAVIHDILTSVDNVVRWGGDYTGRRDEMHFEINDDKAAVTRVAAKLRKDDDVSAPEVWGYKNTNAEPGTRRGDAGDAYAQLINAADDAYTVRRTLGAVQGGGIAKRLDGIDAALSSLQAAVTALQAAINPPAGNAP